MSLSIAAVQLAGCELSDWRTARRRIGETLLHVRSRCEAELLVLPEGAWPAYAFGSPADYLRQLEAGMPDEAATLSWLSDLAQRLRVGLCVGCIFPRDGGLANVAVLIGPDGRILGEHQKIFLWDFDHDLYVPGDRITPVETPWGRVGMMICADARMPEIAASLVRRGAQVILQPTAWVNCGRPEAPWNPQPEFLIGSRAAEFGVPIVSASKCGAEHGVAFVGRSLVCDADGRVRAQLGSEPASFATAGIELPNRGQVQCGDAQRARLLDPQPPHLPPADVPLLRIWIGRPPAVAPDDAAPAVDLVIRPPGITACALPPGTLAIDRADGQAIERRGIRMVVVSDHDAGRFAPLRCAALDGAHLAIVLGESVQPVHVRTRAAENRMFVLWIRPGHWSACDPTGQWVGEGRWPADPPEDEPDLLLDPGLAADKHFAPRTDALADRRVALYAL